MNRRDLKNIALTRLKEVEVLLNNRQYSGAYYLSGYIIECALKACIAKQTHKFDFPDKKTAIDSYTHDLEKLEKLVKVAKLDAELKIDWTAIVAVSVKHKLIEGLRQLQQHWDLNLSGKRMTNNMVNQMPISDAYIYQIK